MALRREFLPWLIALPLVAAAVAVALAPSARAAAAAQQDFETAMTRTPDLANGQKLYVTCVGCHRDSGMGNRDGTVPVVAGQHRPVTIRQLADYRHARRWDPRMQHYADVHVLADAQAMADVAGYIESLPRGEGSGTGRGDLVQRGNALFAARCAACHGGGGQGDAAGLVPRVAGQHYGYLLRMLNDAIEGTRPSFPTDHIRLLEGLAAEDRIGLADAISRMR
jgi:cytochrome c553